MAYYYYYQPIRTSPDSLLPRTTTTQFTPSPLLLLSSSPEQYLSLPLCTPVVPSTTTSMSMPTTAVVTEHHQQQLPTPNTFIKHCEDMGLFKDLQNVVIRSGPSGDTAATSASITASAPSLSSTVPTPTIQPTTSSFCISSSTAAIKTMMMANPFDETFKQAVLQQQKADTNVSRNVFNNNDNDDGELNTPFIVPTTVEDTSTNSNSSTVASLAVDTRTTVECMTTTRSQPELQDVFTTKAEETPAVGGVSVTTKPQQRDDSIVSVQRERQRNNRIVRRQLVLPSTTTATISRDKGNDGNGHKTAVNDSCVVKQALKQNLLVKQMLRKRQRQPTAVAGKIHEHGRLHRQNVDTVVDMGNNGAYNDDDNGKQLQKQEKLERNRSAAKRCRMKRKQRWQLLSDENRKLKVENVQLRNVLRKLLGEQARWTSQQQQVQLQEDTTQNVCVDGTDD